MTLKQAFMMWSMAPRNIALANNCRDAVNKILMKKYNDIELEQITETFARRVFCKSNESKEMKIKAASILVYVLSWGGDHGYCQRPTFTYEVAASTPEEKPAEPMCKVKPEALAKRKEELAKRENTDIMEKEEKKEVVKPREVVQLDPNTLRVLRTFPSANAAETALGCSNIRRAIDRSSMSGGYYWTYPGYELNFKPAKRKGAGRPSKPKKISVSPQKPVVVNTEAAKPAIQSYSDDALIAEMKRRGWKGNITMTITIDL